MQINEDFLGPAARDCRAPEPDGEVGWARDEDFSALGRSVAMEVGEEPDPPLHPCVPPILVGPLAFS